VTVGSDATAVPERSDAERARIWQVLNSQFGLWILSTVLVGLVSFLYSGFQESNRIYSDDMHRMAIMRDEIADRLEQFDQQVGATLTLGDFVRHVNPWGLDGPTGVYPELQNRSLRGMIVEVEGLARKYRKDAGVTIARLETILATVKEVERMKVGYTDMIAKNPRLANQAVSYTELHNRVVGNETAFQTIELTPEGRSITGKLRRLLAPTPIAGPGQNR
jgi:hypothetical protein